MRFCTNCGHELEDDSVFCINCGTKLEGPAAPAPGVPNAAPAAPVAPAPRVPNAAPAPAPYAGPVPGQGRGPAAPAQAYNRPVPPKAPAPQAAPKPASSSALPNAILIASGVCLLIGIICILLSFGS